MKKRVIYTFIVLLCLLALLGMVACKDNSDDKILALDGVEIYKASEHFDGYATIYKPNETDLKILQLTDPQLDPFIAMGYGQAGGDNEKTIRLIKELVENISPDLVIITGDITMTAIANNWVYMQGYADLFEDLGVFWAPTYGNHDSESTFLASNEDPNEPAEILQNSKEWITNKLTEYPHCLVSIGDCEDGVGNYFINVRNEYNRIVYTFSLMDCVSKFDGNKDDYYYRNKTQSQIDWYERHILTISNMEYGKERGDKVVPSMVFTHVAVPEFYTAWQEAWNDGEPNENYFYGHHLEGNYTNTVNCTFFDKALELKSATAMFFGHHHNNDFSVNYKGIRLTFGQHSGLSHYYRIKKVDSGGYDKSDIEKYGDQRGGTLVTISEKGDKASFTIAPMYAYEVIEGYSDWAIDYDKVEGTNK